MFISRTSRRRAERERRWRNKRVEDRSIVGLFPASHRKAESSSLCLCFKSEAAENSTCMDKYHPPFFHVSFPFIPVQKQRQMQHLSVRENTGKRVHNHQCWCGRAAVAPESVQAGVTRWNHITSLPLGSIAPSLRCVELPRDACQRSPQLNNLLLSLFPLYSPLSLLSSIAPFRTHPFTTCFALCLRMPGRVFIPFYFCSSCSFARCSSCLRFT